MAYSLHFLALLYTKINTCTAAADDIRQHANFIFCVNVRFILPFVIDQEESGPGLVGGLITGMAILGLSPYKNTLIKYTGFRLNFSLHFSASKQVGSHLHKQVHK